MMRSDSLTLSSFRYFRAAGRQLKTYIAVFFEVATSCCAACATLTLPSVAAGWSTYMVRVVLFSDNDRDGADAVAHVLTLAGHEVLFSPALEGHTSATLRCLVGRAADVMEPSPLEDARPGSQLFAMSEGEPQAATLLVAPCTTLPAGGHAECHAVGRWAQLILRSLLLHADPRTLAEWGKSLGASTGALRNWCRTARLPARRSLLFARLLRAVALHQSTGVEPEDLLDVADRRTLQKLMAIGGGTTRSLPTTIEGFLTNQRLIDREDAVARIRRELSDLYGRNALTRRPPAAGTGG